MRVLHRSSVVILALVLLGVMAVVLSCAPVEAGPRAWIDWPTEGFETEVGTTVTLIAHAYAENGVAEVQLAVDRQPYRVVAPDQAGEQFVEVSMEWFAGEAGPYLLSVTAFDLNGQASNPASVTVSVKGEGPELFISPEAGETPPSATATPEEPAATAEATPSQPPTATLPPPTGTPLPPTATQPRPTATLVPPRIVSFEVSDSQITLGECVTFSYVVAGSPDAIFFNGEGVVGPSGSVDRCPTATREFRLTAEVGGQVVDSASLTVVVIQPSPTPADTEGPLIQNETGPQQMWAPDGSACREDEPYQFQAKVSDPSGVLWVKLVYSIKDGPEQSGGMQLVSGTTYRMNLTLPNLQGDGGTLHWRIRACDKVNPMNCSDGGTHTITILDCPI
jgi:hypothetical protein